MLVYNRASRMHDSIPSSPTRFELSAAAAFLTFPAPKHHDFLLEATLDQFDGDLSNVDSWSSPVFTRRVPQSKDVRGAFCRSGLHDL